MAKMVTPHFSHAELSCKCCDVMGADWRLLQGLEALRSAYKKPIPINSAFRCPTHNRAIGGVANSQHVEGRAADCAVVGGTNRYRFIALAMRLGFRGIGVYREFVHIDLRDGRQVLWWG